MSVGWPQANGRSALDMSRDGPKEILAAAAERQIDLVIIEDWARLARDPDDLQRILDLLAAGGGHRGPRAPNDPTNHGGWSRPQYKSTHFFVPARRIGTADATARVRDACGRPREVRPLPRVSKSWTF
jgi:hypothetical protein